MLWFEAIDLMIINFSSSNIHIKIKEKSLDTVSFLTSSFGAPETGKRVKFWNRLGRINPGTDAKWCVMGDFNEITTLDQKVGGRP